MTMIQALTAMVLTWSRRLPDWEIDVSEDGPGVSVVVERGEDRRGMWFEGASDDEVLRAVAMADRGMEGIARWDSVSAWVASPDSVAGVSPVPMPDGVAYYSGPSEHGDRRMWLIPGKFAAWLDTIEGVAVGLTCRADGSRGGMNIPQGRELDAARSVIMHEARRQC